MILFSGVFIFFLSNGDVIELVYGAVRSNESDNFRKVFSTGLVRRE